MEEKEREKTKIATRWKSYKSSYGITNRDAFSRSSRFPPGGLAGRRGCASLRMTFACARLLFSVLSKRVLEWNRQATRSRLRGSKSERERIKKRRKRVWIIVFFNTHRFNYTAIVYLCKNLTHNHENCRYSWRSRVANFRENGGGKLARARVGRRFFLGGVGNPSEGWRKRYDDLFLTFSVEIHLYMILSSVILLYFL